MTILKLYLKIPIIESIYMKYAIIRYSISKYTIHDKHFKINKHKIKKRILKIPRITLSLIVQQKGTSSFLLLHDTFLENHFTVTPLEYLPTGQLISTFYKVEAQHVSIPYLHLESEKWPLSVDFLLRVSREIRSRDMSTASLNAHTHTHETVILSHRAIIEKQPPRFPRKQVVSTFAWRFYGIPIRRRDAIARRLIWPIYPR